jgi:hypothetical protein
MKRLFLFSLIMAFVLASTVVYAQEKAQPGKAPLGIGNLGLKFEYIDFTENMFEDLGIEDAFYVGVEGYAEISPGVYLGAEIGYANPDGRGKIGRIGMNTDLTFIPIELNLKYALKAYRNIVVDFGGGACYNYVEANVSEETKRIKSGDDWLFGGQLFLNLNYTIDQFFIGLGAKYQITDEFEDWNENFNNLRFGGKIGIMF